MLQGQHGPGAAPAPPAAPAAAPHASWADIHRGVQQQQAANVSAHTSPELAAPTPAAHSLAAPAATPAAAAPTAAPASEAAAPAAAASRGAGSFMRPLKRGLGLAALGAGGAMALGAHHQNQRDREGRDLIYAPMTGEY